jgi:hypothetical protein
MHAFAARLDDLSEETRLMLLAVALDSRASLDEQLRSAVVVRGSAVEISAVDSAVEAVLVDIVEARVRFRHPLIRSAVEQAASPAQVLAMYAALAEVVVDPERRLWHRAMAAVGCDEELAAALDAHAAVARRRGTVAAAAAALERAAVLTPEPVRKGQRLVRAAEVETSSGGSRCPTPTSARGSGRGRSSGGGALRLAGAHGQRGRLGSAWRSEGVRRDRQTDAWRRRHRDGAPLAGADRAPVLVDAAPPPNTTVRRRHG